MSDNTYSLEKIIVSNPTFCFSVQEYQKAKVRDTLPCHCTICNKDFYTEKRRINKFLNGKIKNLYCSKSCAFEAAKKPVEKHESYYCEKCGKLVDSEQYYGSGRFCCKSCSMSYSSSFVSLEDKRKNFIPAREKYKQIKANEKSKFIINDFYTLIEYLKKWNPSDLIRMKYMSRTTYRNLNENYDLSSYTSQYITNRLSTINFCRTVLQKPIENGSITIDDFKLVQQIIQDHILRDKLTSQEIGILYNYPKDANPFLRHCIKVKLLSPGEAIHENHMRKTGHLATPQDEYYRQVRFKIPYALWKYLPGWDLYLRHGIYDPVNNPNGVDRDHIVSRSYGWKHDIDPYLIRHPANCQFLIHNINCKKYVSCSMTVTQLIERAQMFNETILDPDFDIETFPLDTFHSL